jgi:hypothetical protein
MRILIHTLQKIVSRRGSSKVLSFSAPHVLKALRMLYLEKYVSRASFCKELHMGEGAVKTLILHLKEEGLVDSVKSGTFLTKKGQKLADNFFKLIPCECIVPKSKTIEGKYNHAILLRNYANEIKTGIEQRDAAILYGASRAITILYSKNKFIFPGYGADCLQDDGKTRSILLEKLNPNENDVVIIATASDPYVAEISAKNSALFTIASS